MRILTCGCFDLFHSSHQHYLAVIKERYPDCRLIVAVGDNASVRRLKGKDRPCHDAEVRQQYLENCEHVDEIHIFDVFAGHTEYQAGHKILLEKVKPDRVVSGKGSPNRGIEPFLGEIPHDIIDIGDAETRLTTTKIIESHV